MCRREEYPAASGRPLGLLVQPGGRSEHPRPLGGDEPVRSALALGERLATGQLACHRRYRHQRLTALSNAGTAPEGLASSGQLRSAKSDITSAPKQSAASG